jgi:hypothetical protein
MLKADAGQLTVLLSAYGPHLAYIEQCKSAHKDISDDPWSLRNLSTAVYHVLRDRWDVVQSVYELAIYEFSRDIQRSDEYIEALQWNTCHPHVHAIHLFIESSASQSRFNELTSQTLLFHDPCKKLRRVPLMKRLHYKDALIYANSISGSTVMITNSDVVLAGGFGSMPNLNAFLKEEKRLFALSRHERPVSVIQLAVVFDVFHCSTQGFLDRGLCCSETSYDGCHDSFMYDFS